jgi:hypothetical protein
MNESRDKTIRSPEREDDGPAIPDAAEQLGGKARPFPRTWCINFKIIR